MSEDRQHNSGQETADRRVERLAELGALTAHLAHELRNPLSTIKVNLSLLAEDVAGLARELRDQEEPGGDDDAAAMRRQDRLNRLRRQLRKIETVTKETDRLSDTLTDFLRYAGRLEIHPVRCDVNELLDELIDFCEPQARGAGVTIRHCLHGAAVVCRVDTDLIKQALLNIFINAVQAMSGGGEFMVRSGVVGDWARIDLTDTGPGIPREQQEKIFKPYYTTRSGGTGLGLAMCRRIVEEHDGRIELVSEPGKGSNFTIWLPRLKEPEAAAAEGPAGRPPAREES